MERLKLSILVDRKSASTFVESAILSADRNKDALGFYSSTVFREFAGREQLFIAIDTAEGTPQYVGHLLFDCRYPRCSILQVNVVEEARRFGVARKLLSTLKDQLIPVGFTSIVARVAEDLTVANSFYHSQGFYVQSVVKGGASRGRMILRRVLELPTPQLFSRSGISDSDPLGLVSTLPIEQPVFLLDLNVVRDIGPRRARSKTVVQLFRGERLGLYTLGVSSEAQSELKRTAIGKTDPLADFVRVFPEFNLPKTKAVDELCKALLKLVFPSTVDIASATPQQVSDLRHIATAIHFKLAGVITSDSAMLEAGKSLLANYGVRTDSPDAVIVSLPDSPDVVDVASSSLVQIEVRSMHGTDLLSHRGFLERRLLENGQTLERWTRWDMEDTGHHYLATIGSDVAGYAGLRVGARGTVEARLAIDESMPTPELVCSALIRRLEDHLTDGAVRTVQIELPPNQAVTRETALRWGFRGPNDGNSLIKTYGARVVTPKSWPAFRALLLKVSGIKIPSAAPPYLHPDQQIAVVTPKGEQTFQSLELLETLLRPFIFALHGRPAVLTPIRREFSAGLLEHLPQKSLLGHAKPSMFPVKHYVAGSQVSQRVDRGTLMLFYESGKNGGASAVIAVSRIRQTYKKSIELLNEEDLDPSILDGESISRIGTSKQKTVLIFDNIILFENPVGLNTLRSFGCGEPHQLLSTSIITPDQLQSILDHAFSSR